MNIPKTQRRVGVHQLSIGKPKKLSAKIPTPAFPKLPKLTLPKVPKLSYMPTKHTNKSRY